MTVDGIRKWEFGSRKFSIAERGISKQRAWRIGHSVKKETGGENGLIADFGMRIADLSRRAHSFMEFTQMP